MLSLIGLVLYWVACFGGEVVELEPVKALSFECNRLTFLGSGGCAQNPYCYWNSTKCDDDPCLLKYNRTLADMYDTCEQTNNVACVRKQLSSVTGHDCYKGTDDTGILCMASAKADVSDWDYCSYAYIRDSKCPRSICKIADANDAPNPYNLVGCIPYNRGAAGVVTQCEMLGQDDCKLVPKCWWNSSSGGRCVQDPCLEGTENGDKDCATWKGNDASRGLVNGDCVTFKPLKRQSTDIVNYCIYKENKEPNICYFAGRNDSSGTDYTVTYPTYNFGTQNPECDDTYTDCEGTGDCYTTFNAVGALAGRYCTDGTHGSANIIRIPSVLVFLILSALSIVSML